MARGNQLFAELNVTSLYLAQVDYLDEILDTAEIGSVQGVERQMMGAGRCRDHQVHGPRPTNFAAGGNQAGANLTIGPRASSAKVNADTAMLDGRRPISTVSRAITTDVSSRPGSGVRPFPRGGIDESVEVFSEALGIDGRSADESFCDLVSRSEVTAIERSPPLALLLIGHPRHEDQRSNLQTKDFGEHHGADRPPRRAGGRRRGHGAR